MKPLLATRVGVCRCVFLVGPWAVKVPRLASYGHGLAGRVASLGRGLNANASERSWAGSAPGFAPLLWSAAGVANVYARCEPVPGDFTDYDAIDAPTVVGDRKPANVGIHQGRLVWVDYDTSWNGCPHAAWNEQPDDEDVMAA